MTLKDGLIVLCSTMQQQPGHGMNEMSVLKNLLAPKPNWLFKTLYLWHIRLMSFLVKLTVTICDMMVWFVHAFMPCYMVCPFIIWIETFIAFCTIRRSMHLFYAYTLILNFVMFYGMYICYMNRNLCILPCHRVYPFVLWIWIHNALILP